MFISARLASASGRSSRNSEGGRRTEEENRNRKKVENGGDGGEVVENRNGGRDGRSGQQSDERVRMGEGGSDESVDGVVAATGSVGHPCLRGHPHIHHCPLLALRRLLGGYRFSALRLPPRCSLRLLS